MSRFLFLILGCLMFCSCRSLIPPRVIRNMAYVPEGGERQQGDLYLPEGDGPFPVAVVLHGGGWRGRDRSDMKDVAERLAGHGIVSFNMNYRLAPDHRFPAQVDDVHAALRYLSGLEEEYPLDLSKMITVGYSAGGHLALLAASNPPQGHPPVRAVLAGGAPTDLTAYPQNDHVSALMGEGPVSEEKLREASPVHQVTSTHPPVFLYHGEWDAIVAIENSTRMRDALQEAGVPTMLQVRSYLGHILAYILDGPSIRRGIEFLQDQKILPSDQSIKD